MPPLTSYRIRYMFSSIDLQNNIYGRYLLGNTFLILKCLALWGYVLLPIQFIYAKVITKYIRELINPVWIELLT